MVKFSSFSWEGMLLCLILACVPSTLFAQHEASLGASSAAQANANLFLCGAWTTSNNSALIPKLEKTSFGVALHSPFLINELNSKNVSLAIPFKSSGLGSSFSRFGYSNYREDLFSIAYGQIFGPKFSMGIKIDHYTIQMLEPYGKRSAFSADLSLWNRLSEKAELAVQLINPGNFSKNSSDDEYFSQIVKAGLGYKITDYLFSTLLFQKVQAQKAFIAGGLEHSFNDSFAIRLGYSSEIDEFTFGFGWRLKGVSSDLAAAYNPILGFSSSISISYEVGR